MPKLQRRRAKLSPDDIRKLFDDYMVLRAELIGDGLLNAHSRAMLVSRLRIRYGLSEAMVRKILRRQLWTCVPIPDGWMPFC